VESAEPRDLGRGRERRWFMDSNCHCEARGTSNVAISGQSGASYLFSQLSLQPTVASANRRPTRITLFPTLPRNLGFGLAQPPVNRAELIPFD
jgi:hypothetical protein